MEEVKYDELRKILIEEVQNYNGQSLIRLNIDKEVIEQIFFIPKIETYIEDGRAHKEIRGKVFAPNISMDILEKIDFSNFSFEDFNTNGFDFSKLQNVNINPQTLYEKSLYNCVCQGVTFVGNFDEVSVQYVCFEGSKGAIINPQTIRNKDLSYNDCADVEFVGDFDDVYVKGTNFTGSKGVIINPQKLKKKSLWETVCFGVKFVGPFDGVIVRETNFKGSEGAIINPQTVLWKTLFRTICTDVEFIGSFDDVAIDYTNFTGSKGTKINPQKVRNKSLIGAICSDVEFIAPLDGVNTEGAFLENAKFYIPLFESKDNFRAKIKSLIDVSKC